MTRAKGSLDFLSRECVVGIALRVDRTYLGGQLAFGEGVTLVCGYQWEYHPSAGVANSHSGVR